MDNPKSTINKQWIKYVFNFNYSNIVMAEFLDFWYSKAVGVTHDENEIVKNILLKAIERNKESATQYEQSTLDSFQDCYYCGKSLKLKNSNNI